jgi:SanA protein
VEYLVVSGDNSRKDYDEPSAMREALMELGVPAERIYRDYAGFRTLDSVVRAQEIFGLDAPVFVSQRFHNQRALYLARSRGMEATAYEAWEPPLRYAMRTRAREVAARAAAVLDVRVLRRQPKFLGEPVLLGGPPS